ncbi:MAG: hypothetical protein CO125_01235 [Hydrogenophilales bacterium CG_4_9_14_3_um_filter_59_35]|nr:MAG: hypothetical protein COW70_08675 [Hydrogenophilales bacterium CG18_big_fil_WC_8_21_14_2_50_58_12]PIX99210.1 MAG: hypothetical protein COZ23_11810 [Hydrogenophilales bacterium CG_4_10_14_3_um_filter_58_23]PJB08591.1 MAG: hypothetical protein CO125_01235 [Hydrogenophilales bacterium CG_4_9_14_3_um_filter_59_35]
MKLPFAVLAATVFSLSAAFPAVAAEPGELIAAPATAVAPSAHKAKKVKKAEKAKKAKKAKKVSKHKARKVRKAR